MKRLLFALLIAFATGTEGAPSLVVLDVGEGQAILLQEEHHGILIDTGHPGMSQHLLQRLEALGVRQLDYLVLTHLHPDHAGGYFRLREQFPDTPLLYSGHPLSSRIRPDLVRWLNQAVTADQHWKKFLAGGRIHWRGLILEALWPTTFDNANLNRHSLVILIRYRGLKLLLMGDADSVVEQRLLDENKLPSQVDLLVAGHHGAADATSEAFVAKVQPRIAVISVNENNIRGYPSSDVVARLKHSGAHLLRTDRDGELRFELRCTTGSVTKDQTLESSCKIIPKGEHDH